MPEEKNNKKSWIIAIVVVIILVILYMLWGSSKNTVSYGENSSDTSSVGTGNGPLSMKDLVASQKPEQCSFSNVSGTAQTSGTIFVGNGLMRGDFVATDASGKKIESHTIMNNGVSYIWTSESKQGFKMTVGDTAAASGVPSAYAQYQPVSYDAKVDYKCSPWVVNGSSFTVPADITFTDMSEMMKNVPPMPKVPGY